MQKVFKFTILLTGLLMGMNLAFAQEPIIYPAKGQNSQQMEKDKGECYVWAKGQTGFDPMQPPQTSAPPPAQPPPQGGVVKGAARGAVVGAAVGSFSGEAGKGSRSRGCRRGFGRGNEKERSEPTAGGGAAAGGGPAGRCLQPETQFLQPRLRRLYGRARVHGEVKMVS